MEEEVETRREHPNVKWKAITEAGGDGWREGKKQAARTKRRRGRKAQRAARKARVNARVRSRLIGEFVVGTFNVRTLAFEGANGTRHIEVVLKTCQEL